MHQHFGAPTAIPTIALTNKNKVRAELASSILIRQHAFSHTYGMIGKTPVCLKHACPHTPVSQG